MDGDVDGIVELGGVQLLREQALAAGFAQRPVGDGVAGRLDDDDLDRVLVHAVRGRQPAAGLARLGERQRAAARAEP